MFHTIGKIIIGALHKSRPATLLTHPDLVGPYQAMCRQNGINPPPQLLISPNYGGALAMPKENQILVGEFYLNMFPPEAHLGLLAHETAHILCGHTKTEKFTEYMADRLACQLLGTHKPLISMVETMNSFPRLATNDALREQLYGTNEERLSNINKTNLDGLEELQSWIDGYVKKHAHRKRN